MNPERPLSTAQLISRIKQGLKKQRPGYRAQLKMGPKPRPGSREIKNGSTAERQAGVLILVYPVEGDLWTVLTQRTERMEHHRGQISFPGGRNEAGETLEQTALREANEELGIPTSDVKIMGRLTPLYIPPSGFCITPTVAYLPRRPEFVPAPEEVEQIIEIPLTYLLDPSVVEEEYWTVGGRTVKVPFYVWEEHRIWGATAMVLAEFLEVVLGESSTVGTSI